MAASLWSICLVAVLVRGVQCDSWCSEDVTNCCQCMAKPGCSWFHDPSQPRAFCSDTPIPGMSADHNHAPEFITPRELTSLNITHNEPLSEPEGKLIAPQAVRLRMAPGARTYVNFEVLPTANNRLKLKVVGNMGAPTFYLERGDSMSCSRTFRKAGQRRSNGQGRGRGPGTRPRRISPRGRGGRRERSARRDAAERRNNRRQGERRRGGRGQRRGRRPTQIGDSNRPLVDKYVCRTHTSGQVQKLRLVVDMNACLDANTIITIRVKGGDNTQRLIVDLQPDCACPCQGESSGANTARRASRCENGRERCNADSEITAPEGCLRRNDQCVSPGSDNTGALCSGNGTCVCGSCLCYPDPNQSGYPENTIYRMTGTFCECSDFSCPRHGGHLCGGENRGVCTCGRCACRPGYSGSACQIDMSIDNCVDGAAPDLAVCSNHGMCVSGACQCEYGYTGRYCES